MLREPVSRTISAYRYAMDRGWINEDKNIIDWFHEKENKDKKHYQINYCSGVSIDAPLEIKLDKALINLKSENFLFGLTSKYNEFVDLCCLVNDWKPQYRRINITKAKKEISKDDRKELEELLLDEINFYEEAVNIYNKKYKKVTI